MVDSARSQMVTGIQSFHISQVRISAHPGSFLPSSRDDPPGRVPQRVLCGALESLVSPDHQFEIWRGHDVTQRLLSLLMMNRAGTRLGRATWWYFAFCAALFLVRLPENLTIWLMLSAPIILLFNRFDRSGPTLEEAREKAKRLANAQEAEYLARQKSTLPYRFGKWLRRHLFQNG